MSIVNAEGLATQTTTNPSVTFNATAGNYLAACCFHENDTFVPNFSTTAGSTSAWTSRQTLIDGGNFATMRMSTAVVSTTGSITIQASRQSGSAFLGIMVLELSNIANYLSASVFNADGADPRESASETPSAYDAMLTGFALDWSGGGFPTATTNWTEEFTGLAYGVQDIGAAESRLYTSGDAQASFGGFDSNPVFVGHMLFEESGTAPGNQVVLSDAIQVLDGSPVN